MKRITIDRWSGAEKVSKENWKDLISALVLVGYEAYGDDERITFVLGDGDIVEEIEREDK